MASGEQMFVNIPSLRTKYPAYAAYAGELLEDIFPSEQLEAATIRTATEFASVLLMNNGDETFDVEPLPVEALATKQSVLRPTSMRSEQCSTRC